MPACIFLLALRALIVRLAAEDGDLGALITSPGRTLWGREQVRGLRQVVSKPPSLAG
jgi:hypothetical protein